MTSPKLPKVGETYGTGKLARTVTGYEYQHVLWVNTTGRAGRCWRSSWDAWVAKQAKAEAQPSPLAERVKVLEGAIQRWAARLDEGDIVQGDGVRGVVQEMLKEAPHGPE